MKTLLLVGLSYLGAVYIRSNGSFMYHLYGRIGDWGCGKESLYFKVWLYHGVAEHVDPGGRVDLDMTFPLPSCMTLGKSFHFSNVR